MNVILIQVKIKNNMLDYDFTYLGCGNKISAKNLINLGFIENYSKLENDSEFARLYDKDVAVSVDTVMPISNSIKLYVESTFYHCANDLYSYGVIPKYCTISFGFYFGLSDLEKKDIVEEMNKVLRLESVRCVNFHSYLSDQTSITMTIFGEKDLDVLDCSKINSGMKIILTKPILDYGLDHDSSDSWVLSTSNKIVVELKKRYNVICKDVSGFGLIGSIFPFLYDSSCGVKLYKHSEFYIGDNKEEHCSFRRNIESFSDYVSSEIRDDFMFNKMFIGQTNGPVVIFTNDCEQVLSYLSLHDLCPILIGEVVTSGSDIKIDFK
ncbi:MULTISPECIES: hypothetical protein [Vibrio]|uniref:hypothetical protein n=1 Tax=Vibrio TaxID=662 RepID=UPI001EED048F|nr:MULTISPECIES: hypothetical protein [Vibrio]EHA1205342.1 hypothetical protein [Vibrio alginolyticus]ELA6769953.1 hypothetical protein [Vibrio alginolyticus]MCK8112194.1 hypothetical protein [Vibrio sp. 2CM40D]ULF75115.1 hypothetical protein K6748_20175 [Vibrio alginolyticus]